MAEIKIKMKTGAVLKAIEKNAQPRLTIMADELREHLAGLLDAGSLPIQSDTHALALSLSVQTPQGSDSDIRTRMAGQAYVAGGRHTAAVRLNVSSKAYTQAHFDARVAAEGIMTSRGARARVFTRLAYGTWWFVGHENQFTRRYETPRDWIEGPSVNWATPRAASYFAGLI